MSKKQKYLIALAGLFHDIGKFYQRATGEKTTEEEKKEFGYAHAVLSGKLLDNDLNEGLSEVFTEDELKFIKEGVYHHNPYTPIQFLLQKADWVSSSEREKVEAEYILDMDILKEEIKQISQKHPRLRSIFERLKLSREPNKKGFVYKIKKLELSRDIFPLDLEHDVVYKLSYENAKVEEILGSYKSHWDSFKEEFNSKLKNCKIKFNQHPEKVFSLIYHLLYKYLWCIPASIYDKENYSNHYPDISLFDHSRVLSAVACCFYDYDKDAFTQKTTQEFKDFFKDKKVFLHVKADISGIQRFIYNVYPGKGGVAKILRGRSFYVVMLWEILARYILNKLDYPLSNLLYSGGGIFEILVANTKENKEKLEEIKKEINRFLASEFEADLGLSLATYEYTPVDMMDNYKSVLTKLNENLDNAKKEKFANLIETGEIFKFLNEKSNNIQSNKEKCPVCQKYLIDGNLPEEEKICEICNIFKNIGTHLPRTKSLVFYFKNDLKDKIQNKNDKDKVISFGIFGSVYLITDKNSKDLKTLYNFPQTTEILDINNTSLEKEYITGFKFIGKVVPKATAKIPKTETGEEEEINEGQIAPFTYLAKFSEGDERIGIIRMDVDNLGKLFSDGLGEKISISRIATLSRSLDLFFSGYLNNICKELSEEYKKKYPDTKIEDFFYILYAGGDDVFIVAPWDKAIDALEKIQDEFKNYTCQNPNVSISAGYIQTKPKFPIRVSADLAGEAEEIAKSSGKDRVCILGDVLKWEDLEMAKEIAQKWINYIKEDKLQRGFIYAIHRLKEQFLKDDKKQKSLIFPYKEEENPMFYPYIQYYIARNIKDDIREEIANLLLNNKKEIFNKLSFIINYTSLKTRKS
ncbi:MAG: type III-A CRISPR-associated protein Cas10/Csm1 [Hydrogenothermus sp.]|nr:MAG: type III-A CRISPR-associated protein Cas10/Csm1 [Hydrogenothermus sp.]